MKYLLDQIVRSRVVEAAAFVHVDNAIFMRQHKKMMKF